MKGLEIKRGAEKFSVAVPEGFVSVLLNQVADECHLSVIGRDLENGTKIVWLDEKLDEGESVKVVFDDIRDEPAAPASVVKSGDEPLRVMLRKYNWAKSYLEEKGII